MIAMIVIVLLQEEDLLKFTKDFYIPISKLQLSTTNQLEVYLVYLMKVSIMKMIILFRKKQKL